MIIDTLIDKIIEMQNPTAFGIDTRLEYLPAEMMKNKDNLTFEDAASLILEFNFALIDALHTIVPCAKVQSAYYEMYGYEGVKAFAKTCEYAKSKGLIVIADVKRNDIGSTSEAYANAYIGITPLVQKPAFRCDFATVNGYLGSDGILPFVETCKNNDKGIFMLVKTSNPSSSEIQDKLIDGKPLYSLMGKQVKEYGKDLIGKYGYSSVGAVVGATHPSEATELRKELESVFFLIPGYGAQGAKGTDIVASFDNNGLGGIINASRSILCAYRNEKYSGQDFISAAKNAAIDMQEDILLSLEKSHKKMIESIK